MDITVEAETETEAEEIAGEMYNNGEYDDSDEDFENTYIELIEEED